MKIIRNILMICFSLLIYHPLYGKCSNLQIGKMIKMGLSEEEITEVCGKPTIKSEDKPKPVVEESKPVVEEPKIKPIKYSDKLGIRGNEGNLSTRNELVNFLEGGGLSKRYLNPPKVTDTRLYVGLGQVIYSIEYNKLKTDDTLETENFVTDTGMYIGIDSRLFDDNLHYISFLYSTHDIKYNQKSRTDLTSNNVNYYNQFEGDSNSNYELMTLEYIHHLSETFLLGISYNSTSLKESIKSNYQFYDSETDSTSGLNSGSIKFESKHEYTYQRVRLQKVTDNLRFDFVYLPEVTSKENYSGDYTGESTTGFGRFLGLNVTKLDYKNDISFGYYKENENTDTSDPENILYSFGYILEPISGLVFKGIIDYNKSEGITSSVNPYTSITIDGTVL
ncbi:uncharacterized protein METZ01_LOCUS271410, partial [marine metagenome]